MWSLIVAIVVGFFAGLIARAIHPGDDKAGFWVSQVHYSPPMAGVYLAYMLKIRQLVLLRLC